MLTKLIFSSLFTFILNINLISSQAPAPPAPPAPPQPHWCPPTSPYKGGPLIGPYGQDCTPSQGDCPAACPVAEKGKPMYQGIRQVGKIVCGFNFDCCTCSIMECTACLELVCNGDSGCFGAKNIQIAGDPLGALISCNGDLSCKETIMQGTNIASIACTGDQSCQYSRMYLECLKTTGCTLDCVGDNSCSSDPALGLNAVFQITNANGLSCSAAACQYGYFNLGQNVGGYISCSAYDSCKGSTIIVDQNIISMTCAGMDGCRGAAVYITNPKNEFELLCGAAFSCEGLQIYITITDPTITTLGSITCNGRSACENMTLMVVTQFPYPSSQELTVAELSCSAPNACANAVIAKSPNVKFTNCFCSTGSLTADAGCNGLRGLPGQC